ncbi:MAG: hypothetical protein MUE91_07300 [Ignavibacteriaceae bacterium]|jgi:hypothetical protein|nr:hypothetical protein [Ignavibacteriaceae bacterium]
MGLLTDEQVQQGQLNYVAIDQGSGKFICQKNIFPGISGDFLGFNKHVYDFKDKEQKKLDIYISDNGAVYQVQFGLHSWMTLGILNCMSNIENLKNGGKLKLTAQKVDNNQKVVVIWNGQSVGWLKNMDELKITGIKDKVKKEAFRDKIIDRFYELLYAKHPYDPEQEVPVQTDSEPEVSSSNEDDPDIPF